MINSCRKLIFSALVAVLVAMATVCFAVVPLGNVKSADAGGAEEVVARFDIEPDQRVLTVIMYHQILKSPKKVSEFVVTPKQFEDDLIELKRRGFETVLPSEVIKFANGRGELPLKPLIITFDDGNYNNIYYGEEILKKHNCKAVFNIVGAFSEYSSTSGDHSKPAYSHMTWEQIRLLDNNSEFEIGNHTYNLHKFKPRYGVKRKQGESDEDYKREVSGDIMRMQQKLADVGVRAQCFAYPFGRYDKISKELLIDLGFEMIFTCSQQQNIVEKGKPEILHSVNRYNRDSRIGTKGFFDKTDYVLGTKRGCLNQCHP
jgi:peptidoglycan/xylan/chitin deacetylase (PgdA/CDA1 family)